MQTTRVPTTAPLRPVDARVDPGFLVSHAIVTVPSGSCRWSRRRRRSSVRGRSRPWMPGALRDHRPRVVLLRDAGRGFVVPHHKEEHLRGFNRPIVDSSPPRGLPRALSAAALRLARPHQGARLSQSDTNVEGRAHYGEQMMVTRGFGGGDPKFRLAQLSEALLRTAAISRASSCTPRDDGG